MIPKTSNEDGGLKMDKLNIGRGEARELIGGGFKEDGGTVYQVADYWITRLERELAEAKAETTMSETGQRYWMDQHNLKVLEVFKLKTELAEVRDEIARLREAIEKALKEFGHFGSSGKMAFILEELIKEEVE